MHARRGLAPSLAAALLAVAAPAQKLAVESSADYSRERAGLAVLVYEDGELTFERYQNGHTATKPQHIFSGTKSFVPMVALIAQAEGLLDLDEKVARTITEWQGDERREQVTVRHLLNFTSGLKNIDSELHSSRTKDKYAAAIACPCVHEPGTRFRYGSNHLMVFGALLQRKLDAAATEEKPLPDDFVGYLKARILDPIDCKVAFWLRDAERQPVLPYGAFMTAREWAKFGLLVLARGRWEDRQLVPAEHFDECFVGTRANPIYGLNFWLRGLEVNRRNPAIPADTVAAAGMFDQRLYIVPSRKLLVVRLGKTGARSGYSDGGFLGALFGAEKGGSGDDPGTRKK